MQTLVMAVTYVLIFVISFFANNWFSSWLQRRRESNR